MTWILTILSIIGVVLNVQKNRLCFLIWMLTNGGWAAIDFKHGLPAQGILFLAYFILAAWGWFNWSDQSVSK